MQNQLQSDVEARMRADERSRLLEHRVEELEKAMKELFSTVAILKSSIAIPIPFTHGDQHTALQASLADNQHSSTSLNTPAEGSSPNEQEFPISLSVNDSEPLEINRLPQNPQTSSFDEQPDSYPQSPHTSSSNPNIGEPWPGVLKRYFRGIVSEMKPKDKESLEIMTAAFIRTESKSDVVRMPYTSRGKVSWVCVPEELEYRYIQAVRNWLENGKFSVGIDFPPKPCDREAWEKERKKKTKEGTGLNSEGSSAPASTSASPLRIQQQVTGDAVSDDAENYGGVTKRGIDDGNLGISGKKRRVDGPALPNTQHQILSTWSLQPPPRFRQLLFPQNLSHFSRSNPQYNILQGHLPLQRVSQRKSFPLSTSLRPWISLLVGHLPIIRQPR
ncbi:hypothetical protein BC829DRAFT_154951 [Chytridium lagenaria]|nr:hypothetical protein BC829DRAFT_154951 [Chytridium lagenaria]